MQSESISPPNHAVIKVIGVGGAGGNAVTRMVDEISGVEFIAANTDQQALGRTQAQTQIQLGRAVTRGLGAGARAQLGRQAAEESRDEIRKVLTNADMLFIAAGMGGGTGTGAAPFIAQIAREMGILTVAVVTRPFSFEGKVRMQNAEAGIAELRMHTDTLVVISNDQLQKTFTGKVGFREALAYADMPLMEACRSITRLITEVGVINVDFADVKTVMQNGGTALMGVGEATGEGRAADAVAKALESPLLEDCEVQGARGVLVHITGGEDLQLHEISEINQTVMDRVGAQAEIIFGASEVQDREGRLQVTIIATGFDQVAREAQRAAAVARGEKPQASVNPQMSAVRATVPAPAATRTVEPIPVPEGAVGGESWRSSAPTAPPRPEERKPPAPVSTPSVWNRLMS